jgi:predicted DCC family thiol-disulfide oxidoreductase YuxK
MDQTPNPILLYDGVCGLCNRFVRFVLQRDRKDSFRFAALQSDFARKILERHGIGAVELDTVYLITSYDTPEEALLDRSDAAIAVLSFLGGFWRLQSVFLRLLPRPVRDWYYNQIARNRYQVFGKYDVCPIPDPKDRHKFLDQTPGTGRQAS